MRCLALGQAWCDAGGSVQFITASGNSWLLQLLEQEGFAVQRLDSRYPDPEDWEVTRDVMAAARDAWLVLDGYHFDAAYQRKVERAGHKLVVIDDMSALSHYYAHVVLNQNIYATDLQYPHGDNTELLLGTRYALLRREFANYRGIRRVVRPIARRVLVTMGGADPENATSIALAALRELAQPDLEVRVIVGAANAHLRQLSAAIQRIGCAGELIVAAPGMAADVAWADVAIAAAGTTSIELAYMGVPALLVVTAENQAPNAAKLEELGAARDLGRMSLNPERIATELHNLLNSSQTRLAMAERGQQLIDGEGAERVVAVLKGEKVRLRPARVEDCKRLWALRNDDFVRAMSGSAAPIPWEKHQQWFASRLADPRCHIFVGIDAEDREVGQVRFDLGGDGSAEVSILIADKWRGQGYGTALLMGGLRRVAHAVDLRFVHAMIKPRNIASIRMFEGAGFRRAGEREVNDGRALHYEWRVQ
jgi:UDP-2,4-diacetamido-2,4,6-trideoxy-beta-L-altropyranose hydrolase